MKSRLFSLLVIFVLLVTVFGIPVNAEENYSESATSQAFYSLVAYARMKKGLSPLYVFDVAHKENNICSTVGEVKNLADGILVYKKGHISAQDWLNSGLTKNVTSGSEWYVIALAQSGNYDFNTYQTALINYLENNMPNALQTAQKYALTLIATGMRAGLVQTIADKPVTDAPLMAEVFGLHILNNGIKSSSYNSEQIITTLLSMQKSDGGWSVMGKYGDVDVTAMVLQALASHYAESTVKSAADRAVSFLASRQNGNGSFSSMGKENCESTAQVITALSDLKIDCLTDKRFQKNGKTPFDGLKLFKLKNGGFSHLASESTSSVDNNSGSSDKTGENATSEKQSAPNNESNVSSSIVSENDKTGDDTLAPDTKPDKKQSATETKANITDASGEKHTKNVSYKLISVIVLFGIFLLITVLLICLKKANRKNIILIICLFVSSCLFLILTNFETTSQHNKTTVKTNTIGTVTISIRCDNITDKAGSDHIPSDGCILPPTTVDIEEGDTVYDVLTYAAKENGIQMEKKGGAGMIYISGIQYIYEFQYGDMSGWVYHVNGESPFIGCDSYYVKPDDKIEWMYTLDLGVDTGNSFDTSKGGDK